MPAPATSGLPIKDEHFEPLSVPHKWLRLEVVLPDLELDTAKPTDQLEHDIADHAAHMNAAVFKRLEDWVKSDDPEAGGKAWGYRHDLQIPASQYTKWYEFLDRVRKSNLAIAIPDIQLSWDLELHTDWLDPSKRDLFIALENVSQMPRQFADETEESIFQASLRLELPAALHQPLKLERIEPSYRYNKYLAYPAMGHNCGVERVQSAADVRVLQTTWTPRYVQPRIVPTSANGVQRLVRALASPGGLDGLAPLVPAMDTWLKDLPSQVKTAEGLDPSDSAGSAREADAFKGDLVKWRSELNSVAAGLQCLKESKAAWKARGARTDKKAVVFEAWLAMNEAMADFMKARFKRDDNEWRLFQLLGLQLGLFGQVGPLSWHSCDNALASQLAPLLEGARLYRTRVHQDTDLVEVVLTKPPAPSQVSRKLESMLSGGWGFRDTKQLLPAIAGGAHRSLIVMTPFFDDVGAEVVLNLFENTAAADKCLIRMRVANPS